jgi:ribosomal protein S18 acetylase RimI-like enzyme
VLCASVARDCVIVRELSDADLPAAVGVVARGMRDNPLHIAALGDDPDMRGQRLARMFAVALPLIHSKGAVLGAFDDNILVGVAGMIAPGRCQPSLMEKLTVMPRLVPAISASAFGRVGRWMTIWAQHDLRQPHWHLGPVAVDAHVQRTGIGTLLMNEYCARLDRVRGTGYLETDKASNVTFYERFGFQTVDEEPVLNTPNWFMKREAR